METTPDKQTKPQLWLIVLGTAIVTVAIVILFLYIFGLLDNPSNQMPVMQTEGMIHTEEMVHSEEMEHTEGMTHDADMSDRQAEVAELGRQVMPFDLERTTHIFNPEDSGGIQQVLSNDGDPQQIKLIQAHLQEEFINFQEGDFGDPAFIHGEGMPGLAALYAGYEQVEISYTELPNGAQLTYSTESPELIEAIHAWFAAQLADHGEHAAPGP